MAFEFTVRIHGTTAFVPKDDKTAVRLLYGRFETQPPLKPIIAYARFHKDNFASSNQRSGIQSPPDHVPAEFADLRHFVLDNEYLTINAESTQPLTLNEKKDPIASTPTGGDQYSLEWLPPIDDITPGAGFVHPDLLEVPIPRKTRSGATPPATTLAARVDFTRGHVQTMGASKMIIDFKDTAGNTVSRPIARDIEVTLTVDGDYVILESAPLDDSKADPTKSIRLEPKDGARVVVTIGNEPVEDIYSPIPEILDDDANAAFEAAEFGLYYELSQNRPADPKLPRVRGRRPSGHLCADGKMKDPTGGN